MKRASVLGSGAVLLGTVLSFACSGGEDSGSGARGGAPGGGSGGAAGVVGMLAGTSGTSVAGVGVAGMSSAGTSGQGAYVVTAEDVLAGGCATSTVTSFVLPSNLLFVLDRSGSMMCNPPPTTDSAACEAAPSRADAALPSKWDITNEALSAALATLPTTASVGLSYFSNDSACGVNAEPGVDIAAISDGHLARVMASLNGVVPQGGTPLVGAIVSAYQHLHAQALAGAITGRSFAVVLTDGEHSEECANPPVCTDAESCYDFLVDSEAPKAAGPGAGIRTFVIGAPGSEPARTVLSQVALAGNTAVPGCDAAMGDCHFDMTKSDDFAGSLSEAMRSIVGEAITCELGLPTPPEGKELDRNAVNVVYTPNAGQAVVVRQNANPACDGSVDGWYYTEGASTKIRLCGSICDALNADDGAKVDVVLGCPVLVE